MLAAWILIAGCALAGEEKPAEASTPIADRLRPVLKQAAAKISGKRVLVLAIADLRNPPENWRVLGELRDQAARGLRKEGVKARISSKIEEFLETWENAGGKKPIQIASLPDLAGSEWIFKISYVLKGKSRTVDMSLIELESNRESWKDSASLKEANVEISKNLPPLNRRMLEFALPKKGKRVGDGESSTFLREAIQSINSQEETGQVFLTKIGIRDPIFPGNALWLEKTQIQVAMVHEVQGASLQLIQQGFDGSGEIVSVTPFDLARRQEGKVTILRPRSFSEAKDDEWYLEELELANIENDLRDWYSSILSRRGCAKVIPHLLQQWHEHPFHGSIGMNMAHRSDQINELESFGPSAIPHLARALDNSEVKSEHLAVLYALGSFEACAEDALPALVRYLKRPKSYETEVAVSTIGNIGQRAEPAIPALLVLAKDPALKPLRWQLFWALQNISPTGKNAMIQFLLESLGFEQGKEFFRVVEALEQIAPGRPETLAAVLPYLRDENPGTRLHAAEIASRFGERAKAAVPVLMEIMNVEMEPRFVRHAAQLLDSIDSNRGLKVFLPLLSDDREQPTERAVVALGGFPSRCKEVVPILIRVTRDPDERLAIDAMESLGALGEGAAAAIPRLIEICRHPLSDVCLRAGTNALTEIGIASPEVLRLFLELLSDPQVDDRHCTIQSIIALAHQGTNYQAVMEMLALARKKDPTTRKNADTALERIR